MKPIVVMNSFSIGTHRARLWKKEAAYSGRRRLLSALVKDALLWSGKPAASMQYPACGPRPPAYDTAFTSGAPAPSR